MPFEPIEVETKQNKMLTASISYMRTIYKGKHMLGARPRLLIVLPTTVASLSKKKFWQLVIGTGKEAGKARIVGMNVATKYTVEPTCMQHAQRFNFGFVPLLGTDIADKEYVALRKISDDEFEIDLPAWFKGDGVK